LQIAYENQLQEFVATVSCSHGGEDQTRFASIGAFRDWLKHLETSLTRDQWQLDGKPVMLADGWPDQPRQ
jgi:hypothetical protein